MISDKFCSLLHSNLSWIPLFCESRWIHWNIYFVCFKPLLHSLYSFFTSYCPFYAFLAWRQENILDSSYNLSHGAHVLATSSFCFLLLPTNIWPLCYIFGPTLFGHLTILLFQFLLLAKFPPSLSNPFLCPLAYSHKFDHFPCFGSAHVQSHCLFFDSYLIYFYL